MRSIPFCYNESLEAEPSRRSFYAVGEAGIFRSKQERADGFVVWVFSSYSPLWIRQARIYLHDHE